MLLSFFVDKEASETGLFAMFLGFSIDDGRQQRHFFGIYDTWNLELIKGAPRRGQIDGHFLSPGIWALAPFFTGLA